MRVESEEVGWEEVGGSGRERPSIAPGFSPTAPRAFIPAAAPGDGQV